MNPHDAAHQLARALKESNEYKNYSAAKQKLKEDAQAQEMVQDLRQLQIQLQGQQLTGQEINQEQLDRLEKMSEIINMNQTAASFLQAEYFMLTIMNDIQKILTDVMGGSMFEGLMNE